MIEKIAKMAEDCAKRSASSGSYIIAILHQPKMPKSLIKKDEE
ncbi:MAG: cyclic lactone autoinducer peptide [Clostridia bacterium]|nr:cyclic lactone autoinducer peptide [Clostridia bacterium]